MAEAQTSPTHAAHTPPHPRDPLGWCLALTGLFALLTGWRLGIPSKPYFDEVHYLPAARELLALFETGAGDYRNREHPLFAKELIALGMGLIGDTPLGWRVMPWLCGVLAYFAAVRALWHASADRFATLAFWIIFTCRQFVRNCWLFFAEAFSYNTGSSYALLLH